MRDCSGGKKVLCGWDGAAIWVSTLLVKMADPKYANLPGIVSLILKRNVSLYMIKKALGID